ncbi:MAG: Hypothetical protein AJITA_01321 [Acetilactobacillus jinshanensis]
MSFPVNRIRNLRNRDIKVAVMNRHSEFEGMGFWRRRAYLLVHPTEFYEVIRILKKVLILRSY